MKEFVSFFSGIIFAIGLGISGMTNPKIVQGFLDVFGHWDYRLLGVMGGAISTHAFLYYLIKKRTKPILTNSFTIPTNKKIDKKLILGAALFGLGWGYSGICPGPGIVSLISGKISMLYFFLSMLFGMKIFQWIEKRKHY